MTTSFLIGQAKHKAFSVGSLTKFLTTATREPHQVLNYCHKYYVAIHTLANLINHGNLLNSYT
jgi:hypothetical protein